MLLKSSSSTICVIITHPFDMDRGGSGGGRARLSWVLLLRSMVGGAGGRGGACFPRSEGWGGGNISSSGILSVETGERYREMLEGGGSVR